LIACVHPVGLVLSTAVKVFLSFSPLGEWLKAIFLIVLSVVFPPDVKETNLNVPLRVTFGLRSGVDGEIFPAPLPRLLYYRGFPVLEVHFME
jgi:hypothetical protein